MSRTKNYAFKGMYMGGFESFESAFEHLEMDFDPVLDALFYYPDGIKTLSPRHRQVYHPTKHTPLGVVGMEYTALNHATCIEVLGTPLVKAGGRIVGGKMTRMGERAYLVFDGLGRIRLSPGDEIIQRYVATNGHGGNDKVELRMTPFRPRSGTSITLDAGSPLGFKHTKFLEQRMDVARKAMDRVNKSWEETVQNIGKMVGIHLTTQEQKDFICAVLPHKGQGAPSARLESMRDEILHLAKTDPSSIMPQCRGTLFGLVNAFTVQADRYQTVVKSRRYSPEDCWIDSRITEASAKRKAVAYATAIALTRNESLKGALSK